MEKKEFLALLNNVSKTIFWSEYINAHPLSRWFLTRDYKFVFLSDTELSDAIKELKKFDINKLWDKNFWGLKTHESICAVASESYYSLVRIIY